MSANLKHYYPTGFRARFTDNPPVWDAAADPYPRTVQVNGLVYVRTDRYTNGKESPLTELDAQGYRTWTLYTGADTKHRWIVSAVALVDAANKPTDQHEEDAPTYGAGSSVWHWKNRSEDYFAAISSLQGDFTPLSFLAGLSEDHEIPDSANDPADIFMQVNGGISDSPRYTIHHDQDDKLIEKEWVLKGSGQQGEYKLYTPFLNGYVVKKFPEELGGEYLDVVPGSEADAYVKGAFVTGQRGTRPKPSEQGVLLKIKFDKRIAVSSPHFIGTQITGYVSVLKQRFTWLNDFTKPDKPDDFTNGYIDIYPPYLYFEDDQIKMVGAPPTIETRLAVSYTIQEKDWVYSPEYDPTPDWFEVDLRIPIDEAWAFDGSWITSISPGASV